MPNRELTITLTKHEALALLNSATVGHMTEMRIGGQPIDIASFREAVLQSNDAKYEIGVVRWNALMDRIATDFAAAFPETEVKVFDADHGMNPPEGLVS
jgi:hypothetical protein